MTGPSSDHTEIERAFEVRRVPDSIGPGTSIRQHYLAIDAEVAVRVRRDGDHHTLTVKGGRGRERTEVEVPLEPEQFEALSALDRGRSIEKQRHRIDLDDGLTAELDRFGGALDGLVRVEVEFSDRTAADAFDPPEWFGVELTDRPGWSNAELATHGRPPPAAD